jgi:hypothetical protein
MTLIWSDSSTLGRRCQRQSEKRSWRLWNPENDCANDTEDFRCFSNAWPVPSLGSRLGNRCMILWHCPKCKNALEAFNDAVGLKIQCSSCGTTVWVPEPEEEVKRPIRERADPIDEDDRYLEPRRRRTRNRDEIAMLPLVAFCFAVGSALLAFVPVFWCLAFPISGVGVVVSIAAVCQKRNKNLSIAALVISILVCLFMAQLIDDVRGALRRL